jgi:hypothetical protein
LCVLLAQLRTDAFASLFENIGVNYYCAFAFVYQKPRDLKNRVVTSLSTLRLLFTDSTPVIDIQQDAVLQQMVQEIVNDG